MSRQRTPLPDRVIARLDQVRAKVLAKSEDPLASARDLRAREEAGERLSYAQKAYWRTALRNPLERA